MSTENKSARTAERKKNVHVLLVTHEQSKEPLTSKEKKSTQEDEK